MAKKNYKEDAVKESLLTVKRVAKVAKGGRRFSFLAVVVAGDKNGRVGCGRRKAKEVSDAREKASKSARKDMEKRRIFLYQDRTIYHDVFGSSGASNVILKRCKSGTGIIAGGPMRAIFEMIGIKDIVAKSFGSSNIFNVIDATFNALSMLSTPKSIAEKRDKKISEIFTSV
jgi:small subunit ribosomal protein S5